MNMHSEIGNGKVTGEPKQFYLACAVDGEGRASTAVRNLKLLLDEKQVSFEDESRAVAFASVFNGGTDPELPDGAEARQFITDGGIVAFRNGIRSTLMRDDDDSVVLRA